MRSSIFGKTFKLRIWTNRWGHYENYQIKITTGGWHIKHLTISGHCKKDGHPILFKILNQDNVCYPIHLDNELRKLWTKIDLEDLEEHQIQTKLNRISKWVIDTEQKNPNFQLTARAKMRFSNKG